MGLGQLPKRSDPSGRAWLHGKLLVALLVERLLGAAESFSPGPPGVGAAAEPVAGGPVPGPRTGPGAHPRCGLATVLAKWDAIRAVPDRV